MEKTTIKVCHPPLLVYSLKHIIIHSSLFSNQIGDIGCEAIAQALQSNYTLINLEWVILVDIAFFSSWN